MVNVSDSKDYKVIGSNPIRHDGYDKVMNINVKAIFALTRDLLPLLLKKASKENPSRVINIGSIDGLRVSSTDNFAYGASKAFVEAAAAAFARDEPGCPTVALRFGWCPRTAEDVAAMREALDGEVTDERTKRGPCSPRDGQKHL